MKITQINQYNQGIGKYKLLSSTAGVGSIITTKVGSYILITDISKWNFIKWANSTVDIIITQNTDERKIYELSKTEVRRRGLDFIDDLRFVRFIREEKNLSNLICLLGVPNMSLNESFNTPNWKTHPIKHALEKSGDTGKGPSDFMIIGTHFPKWFKNRKGELKTIDTWYKNWEKHSRSNQGSPAKIDFAPPRDVNDFVKEYKKKNIEGREINFKEYRELDQLNMVLICPNGHLSNIPWSKFLNWKYQKDNHLLSKENEHGEILNDMEPCCGNSNLYWTESKTKSEGYASIYIECKNCNKKVNLEGINGLKPYCKGEKPWEIEKDNSSIVPQEKCFVRGEMDKGREKMQVSLVTANNMYYANGFSSLFIPIHLAEDTSKELSDALEILFERYERRNSSNPISKEDYWEAKVADDFEEFLNDNAITVEGDLIQFELNLKSIFLNQNQDYSGDSHEEYRWQEYRCFSQNNSIENIEENEGISFKDVILPEKLNSYFKKIQQVDELRITNIQLDFTRVKPKERVVRIDQDGLKTINEASVGQNTFANSREEVFVMPANEVYGEGLFFQFDDNKIEEWINQNKDILNHRFSRFFLREIDSQSQGAGLKQKIKNNGFKHFLIHSFSHLMMRELEFSCGYPTASLKERLYISENTDISMSGTLIYTAEGSEGSMGGLVSQGETEKIMEIILKGLNRSLDCSSDPLCWESDGQGIFDLNMSACFSCSLVSETACEELNLGLDRRVLIDKDFGFFKDLLT